MPELFRSRWLVSSYLVALVAHHRAAHITTGTTSPIAESPAVKGVAARQPATSSRQKK
jgi:hypothetical protein